MCERGPTSATVIHTASWAKPSWAHWCSSARYTHLQSHKFRDLSVHRLEMEIIVVFLFLAHATRTIWDQSFHFSFRSKRVCLRKQSVWQWRKKKWFRKKHIYSYSSHFFLHTFLVRHNNIKIVFVFLRISMGVCDRTCVSNSALPIQPNNSIAFVL